MSFRTVLIVVLALMFGGAAALGINVLRNQQAAGSGQDNTVPIVVATVDIPRYTTISTVMVKITQCPKELVPGGAINSLEDAVGRCVIQQIVKDEWVLDGKLAGKGMSGGMAPGIPPGMRAVAIPTPSIASGVAGFILPGNRVDVLMSGITTAHDVNFKGPLVQDVEILAVGQLLDAPADRKVDLRVLTSVTLLVTPDQADTLAQAQTGGTLLLTLRNPQDRVQTSAKPAEDPSGKPSAEPPSQSPQSYIRTIRGNTEGGVQLIIQPPR